MLTRDQLMRRLHAFVIDHGSQKAAAQALGCSPQYLSDVLTGKSEPGPLILEQLGYERIVKYKEMGP